MRITRLRAAGLTVLAVVLALYVWGVFFYDDGDGGRENEIEVEWVQVDPTPLHFDELERPYRTAVLGGGEDIWRVYVAGLRDQPRQLSEQHRAVLSTRWSASGQQVLTSFYSAARTTSAATSAPIIAGYEAWDVAGLRRDWQLTFGLLGAAQIAPAGDRMAFVDRGSGFDGPLFVAETDGRNRRLDGPWDSATPSAWSPDGRYLLISAFSLLSTTAGQRFSGESEYYIVSPYETAALSIGRFRLTPRWSPDSRRLAGFRDANLSIVDVAGGTQVSVELGRGLPDAPVQDLLQAPSWSADGRLLAYLGAVLDAESGAVRLQPSSDVVASSLSPDGTWLARTSRSICTPREQPARPSRAGTLRTEVIEVATGRPAAATDCLFGVLAFHDWLSPESFLSGVLVCDQGCASGSFAASLLSVTAEAALPLTAQGGEQAAFALGTPAAISPDGRQFLLGGASLRVFDATGTLLRTIPVPQGHVASAPSWSPDGQSFSYVAGPLVGSLLPPVVVR